MSPISYITNFILGTRVDATSAKPYLLSIRSSKFFIISTICLAVFTDIFLYGIVVPVLPFALTARAGVEGSGIQKWISILLAVYGGALFVGSPLMGWYADQTSSRRLPLLFGLLALAGATVLMCLARTVALFVVGRLLQGLSAAVVWVVGIALLVDTVGQKEIGEALGWVSLSISLGYLCAPLFAGLVYEKAGYYSVFYMTFGLLFCDIILRLALVEKKIARQWGVEEAGNVEEGVSEGTSTVDNEKPEMVGNVTLDSDDNSLGLKSDKIATGKNDATLSESQTNTINSSKLPPMITLLTSKRLLSALWGCIVKGSLMAALDAVIPVKVKDTFGWDSIGAGLVFLAVVVPSAVAPIVGKLCDTYGARWPVFAGFTSAVPLWVLLRLVTHNSLDQKVLLCALMSLIGLGITFVLGPLMAEITYAVEAKEREQPGRFGVTGAYAQAYGLLIASVAAGCLIGPVWAGYVEESAGWGTMSWSLGLLSLAGAIPCLIYTGGYVGDRNAKTGVERAVGKAALPATPSAREAGSMV